MSLKIICLKETVKAGHWDVTEQAVAAEMLYKNTVAAVSDGTTVTQFDLFENVAKQVKEGRSYILENYVVNKHGITPSLHCKHDNHLACHPVWVPEHLEKEGRNLLCPPCQKMTLKESHPQQDIRLTGRVTAVSSRMFHATCSQFQPKIYLMYSSHSTHN